MNIYTFTFTVCVIKAYLFGVNIKLMYVCSLLHFQHSLTSAESWPKTSFISLLPLLHFGLFSCHSLRIKGCISLARGINALVRVMQMVVFDEQSERVQCCGETFLMIPELIRKVTPSQGRICF